jgi:predicted AAA+ superfamily ATPase
VTKLTVSIDVNKIVVPAALEYIEAAYRTGFGDGERNGKFDDDKEDDAWERYHSLLISDESVEDTTITDGSGNIFTDLNVTVTLDDVSKRIDAICEAHLERCTTAQAAYSADLDALAAAVEASPDINQNAVGMIVLGRVKTLMAEVARAIG